MTNSNDKTLQIYNDNVDKYIEGTHKTVNQHEKDWLDRALKGLTENANIIEIGSAFGKDAQYINSLGYKTQTTDASTGFVKYLNSNGFSAKQFNPIYDDFEEKYDLITANAVMLHFTTKEMSLVLEKALKALKSKGKLAISLKEGEGEGWSDHKVDAPRYFNYWKNEEITDLLTSVGFSNITIVNTPKIKTGPDWLHIIATKG